MRSTTIPDSHVVSFRMGETRRQALVEKLRKTPVRFPADLESSVAEPVLIEVMKVVASTQLVLQKGQADYSVHLDRSEAGGQDHGGMFDISMQLKGLHGAVDGQSVGDAVAAQGDEDRHQNAASLAKTYLEETGVMRYFQAMLQAIVRERPQDPYMFMLEQLQSRTQLWMYKPENGFSVAIRRTPSIGRDEEVDASGYQMRPGERFRVMETREGAGGVLFLRLADGRGWLFDRKPGVGRMCERVHEEGPAGAAPTHARLPTKASVGRRARARALFIASWRSGALREHLRKLRGDPVSAGAKAEPPAKLSEGQSDLRVGDSDRLASSGPKQELRQGLQQELRQGLQQVCLRGELQRAFDEVMGPGPADAGAQPEATPEFHAKAEGDNRQKMRIALEKAHNNGQLKAAFNESSDRHTMEPQNPRARIANGLREVTAVGDIEVAEPQDAPANIENGLHETMVDSDRAAPEDEEAPGGQDASPAQRRRTACPAEQRRSDAELVAVAENLAPQASLFSGRSDAVKLRVRGKLEERCSDGTFDSIFMEAMGATERPPETSRGPLPAEPPAPDPLPPSPDDMSVVQRELQGMRGDNNALREQITLMMQKMEQLRLENDELNDRLDERDGKLLD